MTEQKLLIGDSREVLKTFPEKFFDMSVTSPPYFSLRNYKTKPLIWGGNKDCSHEWNTIKINGQSEHGSDKQMSVRGSHFEETNSHFCSKCNAWSGSLGLEPNISMYINNLCSVFDEVYRVLKSTGSLFVVIDDTRYGSGTGQKDSGKHGYSPDDMCQIKDRATTNRELSSKSLCAVPERFVLEMIRRGWIYKQRIIWKKDNAMCESVKSRFTDDYEFVFWFVKSNKTKFWVNTKLLKVVSKQPLGMNSIEGQDWEWIPCPRCLSSNTDNTTKIPIEISEQVGSPIGRYHRDCKCDNGKIKKSLWRGYDYYFEQQLEPIKQSSIERMKYRPSNTRNKRSVWNISTKGFSGSHFAVFPLDLVKTPIESTCPVQICKKCGLPTFKVYGRPNILKNTAQYDSKYQNAEIGQNPQGFVRSNSIASEREQSREKAKELYPNDREAQKEYINFVHEHGMTESTFLGYATCGCEDDCDAGWVLDPFSGSGTVLEFCRKANRNAVGIELNPNYKELAIKRARLDTPNVKTIDMVGCINQFC